MRVTLPVWIQRERGREKAEVQFRHCDAVQTKTQENNEIVTYGIYFQTCFFFLHYQTRHGGRGKAGTKEKR